MGTQATFTTDAVDGVGVVKIFGEVDLYNVGELEKHLEQAAHPGVQGLVVDVSNADYFDSRTIALLAAFAHKGRETGRPLALVVPNGGFAARILEIAGLSRVVPTHQSVDEAVASIKQPAQA